MNDDNRLSETVDFGPWYSKREPNSKEKMRRIFEAPHIKVDDLGPEHIFSYRDDFGVTVADFDDQHNSFNFQEKTHGVDANWERANREQYYGIIKSFLEYFLINHVDELETMSVSIHVSGKAKSRKFCKELQSEWYSAIARYAESKDPLKNDSEGVVDED